MLLLGLAQELVNGELWLSRGKKTQAGTWSPVRWFWTRGDRGKQVESLEKECERVYKSPTSWTMRM